MRLHTRYYLVETARIEISDFIYNIVEAKGLTTIEIANILAGELWDRSKYSLASGESKPPVEE